MNEIALPLNVRRLLEAPNYVHLSTLRADGSPRSHVVWVGLEGDRILVCTSDHTWKAADMRRDGRVSLSVTDLADPYRMAAVQGRVVEIRADHDCRYMDPISIKYTGRPFPGRGPDRVCFVVAPQKAGARTLDWLRHAPPSEPQQEPSAALDEMVSEIASVIARFVASTAELESSLGQHDELGVRRAVHHLAATSDRAIRLVDPGVTNRASSSSCIQNGTATRAVPLPASRHERTCGLR